MNHNVNLGNLGGGGVNAQNRQTARCALLQRFINITFFLSAFLFVHSTLTAADTTADINEAVKKALQKDLSAHSFEITKVSGNWDISADGSASGRFLAEINAAEGCYLPLQGNADIENALRTMGIQLPNEEDRLFSIKLNQLPDAIRDSLMSQSPFRDIPRLFQAAVPKGEKIMQTGKATLIKFGDAAWQVESKETNPLTYQQHPLPEDWRKASDLNANEHRIDDPKTKEMLQTLIQKQLAYYAEVDTKIAAIQKEFDALTAVVKKELTAKHLKEMPVEITDISVQWTDKRAGDAMGYFTAKAKSTEKRYQFVRNAAGLAQLGITDMYERELNDTFMVIETLPKKYHDELNKMKSKIANAINWNFYAVAAPVGSEIDAVTGTVHLVKYGDADWQVEKVEPPSAPIPLAVDTPAVDTPATPSDAAPAEPMEPAPPAMDTPPAPAVPMEPAPPTVAAVILFSESQLPADARKLDDPKTLEAVNAVKQQRKEYVDRLNEVVNEWKQIQEQGNEAVKKEIAQKHLAGLPLEITDITAKWDYTEDDLSGWFSIKTKATEKLYRKVSHADGLRILDDPSIAPAIGAPDAKMGPAAPTFPTRAESEFDAAIAANNRLPENLRAKSSPSLLQGDFYLFAAEEGVEAVTIQGNVQLTQQEDKAWQIGSMTDVTSVPAVSSVVADSKIEKGGYRLDDPATKRAMERIAEERKAFVEDVKTLTAAHANEQEKAKREKMFAEAILLDDNFLAKQGFFRNNSSSTTRNRNLYLSYGNKTLMDNYGAAQTRLNNFDPQTGDPAVRIQLSEALKQAEDACERERVKITQKVFYTLRSYSVQKQSTPYDGKSSFTMDFGNVDVRFVIHDKNKIAEEIIVSQQDVSAIIPNESFEFIRYGLMDYEITISGSQESINELTQRANNFEVQIVFTNLRRLDDYLCTADVLAIKIIDKRLDNTDVISQVVPDQDDAVVISEDQEAISPAPQRQTSRSSGNTPVIKNEAVRRLGREALRQVLNSL